MASDAFTAFSCAAACEFLMKRFACVCGSISSGHRFVLLMMIPFSIEKASAGSPSIDHWRTCTGSARILPIVHCGVCGVSIATIAASHSSISPPRYAAVNGPRYEIVAAHTSTSPTSAVSWTPSVATVSSHDFASPPRPPMSLSAFESWTVHFATSSSNCCIFSCASSSAASSAATRSVTAFSFASAFWRISVASPSSFSDLAKAWRFGSTSSET